MNVIRPTRLEVSTIYFKRAVRWRRNSSPYISGDAFADLSDFVYNPPPWRNFNQVNLISDAQIIFCRSHELQELFDHHGHEINARVIITGNSDFEFHQVPRNIPKAVRVLFLQNSFISDNQFVFTIPIGIENYRLGVNGNPKLIRGSIPTNPKNNRVLFGPLSATHSIRAEVIREFALEDSSWDLNLQRLSPREYNVLASEYSMVAAVRGNGIDTHRLWETLYRSLIPIVSEDGWWKSLGDLFPEVITIATWSKSEIKNITQMIPRKEFNPNEIEALWMPFWEKKIAKYLLD
jgi:hypothetical protein